MTAKHLLDQIVRGLDGVTPGPYDVWVEPTPTVYEAIAEFEAQARASEPFAGAVYLLNAGGKCPATTGCGPSSAANAAHFARCSPEAMREIAAYVRDLEERLAKAAEALEKFTGHYEPWMDRWADDAESSTFSRHTFGQLRSARAIISQIRSEK